MKKTSISMLLAAVLATAFAVSGCHKKADDSAAASSPTPAATSDAGAPGAVAASDAGASGAAAAAAASGSSASNLPAECDSYIKKLEACVSKLGASNPANADQVKQALESVRQQLGATKDKAALAQSCKQANDTVLPQITSKLGCN